MSKHFRNIEEENKYLDLLEEIHEAGLFKDDRTGTGTLSKFGHLMRFDLTENAFPLLTTKRHYHETLTHENIWFISGSTDVKYLKDHGISIWDSWVNPATAKYRMVTTAELGFELLRKARRLFPEAAKDIKYVEARPVAPVVDGVKASLEPVLSGDRTTVTFYCLQEKSIDWGSCKESTVLYTSDELLYHALHQGNTIAPDVVKQLMYEFSNVAGCLGWTLTPDEWVKYPEGASAPYIVEFDGNFMNIRPHPAIVSRFISDGDSSREAYDALTEHFLVTTGLPFRKLVSGSIGKGAYGAMWRDIEDTRIIPLRTKERPLEDIEDDIRQRLGLDLHIHLYFEPNTNHPEVFSTVGVQTGSRGGAFIKKYVFSGGPVVNPFGDPTEIYAIQVKELAKQLGVRLEDTELFDAQDYTSKGFEVKGRLPDGSVVVTRRIDQLQNAINLLRTNPDSRRIIVHAFDNRQTDFVELPPCHSFFQFWSRKLSIYERVQWVMKNDPDLYEDWIGVDHKGASEEDLNRRAHEWFTRNGVPERALRCMLYARSQDTPVGTPFNFAQYALLTHMVAKVTNMVAEEFVWVGADCHIYEDQMDLVRDQMNREPIGQDVKVYIGRNRSKDNPIREIDDIVFEDIEVVGYDNYHPAVPYPVAV